MLTLTSSIYLLQVQHSAAHQAVAQAAWALGPTDPDSRSRAETMLRVVWFPLALSRPVDEDSCAVCKASCAVSFAGSFCSQLYISYHFLIFPSGFDLGGAFARLGFLQQSGPVSQSNTRTLEVVHAPTFLRFSTSIIADVLAVKVRERAT